MKEMWLVQSGRFKKDEDIDNTKEVIGFSHIINLTYMVLCRETEKLIIY